MFINVNQSIIWLLYPTICWLKLEYGPSDRHVIVPGFQMDPWISSEPPLRDTIEDINLCLQAIGRHKGPPCVNSAQRHFAHHKYCIILSEVARRGLTLLLYNSKPVYWVWLIVIKVFAQHYRKWQLFTLNKYPVYKKK